jgi:hypothetical protein
MTHRFKFTKYYCLKHEGTGYFVAAEPFHARTSRDLGKPGISGIFALGSVKKLG